MRPNELAGQLVGKERSVTYGKQIRARLREWYPRDASLKNASWALTAEQVAAVTAWHRSRVSGKPFVFAEWRKAYRSRATAKGTNAPTT